MRLTSFHINTFWHHVEWNREGTIGRDQHGRIFFDRDNPVDETGVFRPERDPNVEIDQAIEDRLFSSEFEADIFFTRKR
jgi:hypothetical protein